MKIAIVGAGLIGRLTALKLILSGHDITILEAQSFEVPNNAAAISAGMIAPMSEAANDNAQMNKLSFRSFHLWPTILAELKELDPIHETVFYEANGSIALSFPVDQSCLFQFQDKLRNAIPDHKNTMRLLYNAEVTELEPELTRFETALFLANESSICNQQFLASSGRAIRQHASIIDFWALKGDGRDLQEQYDWVIDCRGVGAVDAKTYADNPDNKLISVRGEAIRVRTQNVHFQRPIRVIQPCSDVYIVPKPDNHFVIVGTHLDKHCERTVTVRSSLDLLSTLYSLHPKFANAEILNASAGQRAAYQHKEPVISITENIACINGLNRSGWLVGPALVENMLHQIM